MQLRRVALLAGLLVLAGCKDKITGTSPAPASVKPGAACAVQKTSSIALTGTGFSPLATKTLTDQPELVLPKLTLLQTQDTAGGSASSSHALADDQAGKHVTWTSQQAMAFDIYPELALPTGLYDLKVQNGDGNSATLAGAMLLVPPPKATHIEADLLCADQDNTVTISGDFFIQAGDATPTVNITGGSLTAPLVRPTDSLADCRALPGSSGEKACKTLVFKLPKSSLQPGVFNVTVTNPDPVGCVSTDPLALTLVPEPTLTKVDPDLVCSEQSDRTLTLTGTGFITVSAPGDAGTELLQPLVKIGPDKLPAIASNCSPIVGPVNEVAQKCTTLTVTVPKASITPGNYNVVVTNPAPVDCSTQEQVDYTEVPPPTLTKAEPDLACDAQGNRTITLTGTDFLQIGSATPTVNVGSLALTSTASNCTALTGPANETAQKCTTLTVTVAQAALAAGNYNVTVTNPDPAQGTSTQAVDMTIVPAPTLASVVPDLACTAQGDRPVTLTGTGFVQIGSTTPTVTIGGTALVSVASNCTAITGPANETAQACTTLTVSVPQALAAGAYPVVVTNPDPAGCSTQEAVSFLDVPAPTLTSVTPELACNAQGATSLSLVGTGFLLVGTATPSVTVTGAGAPQTFPAAGTNCTAVTGATESVQSCTGLTVSVGAGLLPAGNYSVTVANPAPAGCTTTQAVDLTVVAAPSVASVSTDLFCTANGSVSLTVTGTGFVQVGSTNPTVVLHPSSGSDVSLPATVVGTCAALTGPATTTAQACTQLTVSVPGSVPAGAYQVIVQNPAPVGCSSTEQVLTTVLPAPAVASVQPAQACDNSSTTSVTLTGTNFLQGGSGAPTLTLTGAGGGPLNVSSGVSLSGCTAIPNVAGSLSACTSLTFTLAKADAQALTDGQVAVVVHNPAPAACDSAAPTCPGGGCFAVIAPPSVTSLAPTQLCGAGGTMTLTGTGLQDGTLTLTPSSGTAITAPVTVVAGSNGTQATAAVGNINPATYQASYQVAGGTCQAVATGGSTVWSATVTVIPGPQLFFANPRVVYNGITTEVTFYGAGIQGTVQSLSLQDGSGNLTPLSGINYSNNVVRALVPQGTPAGTYSVVLHDNSSCEADLAGGLVVTGTVQSGIASIDPPFGYKLDTTAVTITGTAHGTFQPLPQAYLNPVNATGSTVATPIRALSLNEPSDTTKPDTLTGVVAPVDASTPLTVGAYDLIVVNPDGTVEFLASAFTVTDKPVPQIATVSPGSFAGGTNTPLTVSGANFDSAATLSLSCVLAGTTTSSTVNGTAVSVTNGGATLTGTVNVPAGDVCVVKVSNPDGTYAQFASVVTTNASGNLSAFVAGPSMTTARAELMAAAGNATSAARFLYAIGGNDGTGVLKSVEAAPVDLYGTPSAFKAQRYELTEGLVDGGAPVPRERGTAVTVGRFIYLVGGSSDGTDALATVDRAEVLDLQDAPQVDNLALIVDADGGGLDPGVWYYRVSAVMADADPNNPGGETLAGDAFGLQLCDPNNASSPTYCPNLAGKKLDVSLSWSTVPGAVAYRVYRSATPDLTPDQTVLLGEVPATATPLAFLDDASLTPGSLAPLDVGALGRWSSVATLATGRVAPAVTSAVDPGDATKVYLYAFGGKNAAGTVLGDYEIVPLALGVDGFGRPTQTPGTVTAGSTHLKTKQGASTVDLNEWLNQAFTGTHETAPTVPSGQVYVYVGPGATNAGGTSTTSTLNYATLSAGASGQLSTLTIFGSGLSGGLEGYGGTLQAGYLNFFGGGSSTSGPSPSTTFSAGRLCGSGINGCTVTTPTDVPSFNANGTGLGTPARVEMATAVQSGTIYVLGGWTAGAPESAPTATTEFTYW